MIKFSKMVSFWGKNGYFSSIGFDLENNKDIITIRPITSKDQIAKCLVQIPKQDIPELIKQLQQL